ncbi:MAG: UDP-N-acetylglucosamine--N-acetylmuramyl-(pentapeptide) pyrophosphoryl-undecaprenol N-acetylglucosam [Idiomarinaceae bacterium HL-53]|nr:MAG: UDP-N-acetylglucosamine--N-acetylmuramyl-(pentapeptide) pyrophosphoryl-undecaprenol N-acetylglucosam [Idiomarinaceae bacterium HL-53]CUS47393.1 UDP-N-acetylglucosamine-N-acetylmuramylpentapeptide N-acetylglucosamine transferase [Idiomarinaceae bacterium HL-53]
MKHVLITAGGTGGHVFPALAVADILRASGWRVSWLGTADKLEAQVVPSAGFEFHAADQSGLRGKGLIGWLKAPFRLLQQLYRMRRFLAQQQPDLVLGFGGYTAGPAGVAAWLQRVPLVIHEQNAAAGLTNKLLAKIATRVLLGFDAAKKQLKKGEVVGNPIRAEIARLAGKNLVREGHQAIHMLIVGGSLGAHHLNTVMPSVLAQWVGMPLVVVHQTGKGKAAEVRETYDATKNERVQVEVMEFVEDMANAYQQADLVICRAGALTCSELACVGRASVLVPYPYAVDNHQLLNAQALAKVGAAEVVEQQAFSVERVMDLLMRLTSEPNAIARMNAAAKSIAQPHAAQSVAEVCAQVLQVTLEVEQG